MTKIKHYVLCLLACAALCLTQSCTEEIDMSDRYTFTELSITAYLEEHPESYSEYVRLLGEAKISKRSSSTVKQLLTARGRYTVFAPTNEAIQTYLGELCEKGLITEPSWEGFTSDAILDSIRRVIVFNSIIDSRDDGTTYQTSNFPSNRENEVAEFPANLNDRKLTVLATANNQIYLDVEWDEEKQEVLRGCRIDDKNRNILASNGYIHQMHAVVAPSSDTVADKLKTLMAKGEGNFIVLAKMLDACGLYDTLSKVKDEVYEEKYQAESETTLKNLANHSSYGKPGYIPEHRYYGYTIFAETDDFWTSVIGKEPMDITVADVQEWLEGQGYYPQALANTDYRDEKNLLYQFVTYHILPVRLPIDKLVIHYNEKGYNYHSSTRYSVATYELYTTMGQRRLLKLYEAPSPEGVFVNRFPELDSGRDGSYTELRCDPDKEGMHINTTGALNVLNGYVYPIDRPLAYTEETRQNFQKQRMRFDVAGIFPEFMNNSIRAEREAVDRKLCVGMPCDNVYKYLDDMDIADGSKFYYLLGLNLNWNNYQGDELNVIGSYQLTLRLPPVPKRGTYEVRFAVQNNSGNRSMCQVYFGTNKQAMRAMGIPLDLRIGGNTVYGGKNFLGWVADENGNEDANAETDKKMRNNGFMKGPEHYCPTPGGTTTARATQTTTRRILLTEELDPDKVYYLRFKDVLGIETKEFYMDYLEICAKEVYDNPQTPEDIW